MVDKETPQTIPEIERQAQRFNLAAKRAHVVADYLQSFRKTSIFDEVFGKRAEKVQRFLDTKDPSKRPDVEIADTTLELGDRRVKTNAQEERFSEKASSLNAKLEKLAATRAKLQSYFNAGVLSEQEYNRALASLGIVSPTTPTADAPKPASKKPRIKKIIIEPDEDILRDTKPIEPKTTVPATTYDIPDDFEDLRETRTFATPTPAGEAQSAAIQTKPSKAEPTQYTPLNQNSKNALRLLVSDSFTYEKFIEALGPMTREGKARKASWQNGSFAVNFIDNHLRVRKFDALLPDEQELLQEIKTFMQQNDLPDAKAFRQWAASFLRTSYEQYSGKISNVRSASAAETATVDKQPDLQDAAKPTPIDIFTITTAITSPAPDVSEEVLPPQLFPHQQTFYTLDDVVRATRADRRQLNQALEHVGIKPVKASRGRHNYKGNYVPFQFSDEEFQTLKDAVEWIKNQGKK